MTGVPSSKTATSSGQHFLLSVSVRPLNEQRSCAFVFSWVIAALGECGCSVTRLDVGGDRSLSAEARRGVPGDKVFGVLVLASGVFALRSGRIGLSVGGLPRVVLRRCIGGVLEVGCCGACAACDACVFRNSTVLCTRLVLGREPVEPAANRALLACCCLSDTDRGAEAIISWELIESLEVEGDGVDKLPWDADLGSVLEVGLCNGVLEVGLFTGCNCDLAIVLFTG